MESKSDLFVSTSIMDGLPSMVKRELQKMTFERQEDFIAEYKRKKKSLSTGYLFLILIGCHYGYLKEWALQVVFWVSLGGFGIWWILDLFRLSDLTNEYNKDLAIEIMRNVKIIEK